MAHFYLKESFSNNEFELKDQLLNFKMKNISQLWLQKQILKLNISSSFTYVMYP